MDTRTHVPAELLLLADGRLPAGGHVHSSGMEQAVAEGVVHDLPTLATWLRAWTATVGDIDATLAAAATAGCGSWSSLLAEHDARVAVPALRAAARDRGRAFVRVADAAFGPLALPAAAHRPGWPLPIATGAVLAAIGRSPRAAATLVLHGGVSESATAAVRLLGLDPVGVTSVLAALAAPIDDAAARAAVTARRPPEAWPAWATPALDLVAATHHARDDRYFVT